ncbi:hypothetical protein TNCT_660421 [Trichonephila clavata]|uniref:Secreted protein n=1 Tax=Trichonephila clavata TaxID=2740835 RepID=A0A8X6GD43_TRICU|nr:hypothetical protein TNCT_660421 [Trichonephila clavata]
MATRLLAALALDSPSLSLLLHNGAFTVQSISAPGRGSTPRVSIMWSEQSVLSRCKGVLVDCGAVLFNPSVG